VPRGHIEISLSQDLCFAQLLIEFNREAGGILFECCDEAGGVRDHEDLRGLGGDADQTRQIKRDAGSRLGAGAPREEATRVGVTHEARFEHGFRQGCRNGSKDSLSEIRKGEAHAPNATTRKVVAGPQRRQEPERRGRARAPDSPMSGKGRKPERPDHRRRAVIGNGAGGEHLTELDHVLLQFGEFCSIWEFIDSSSCRVFVGGFEVVADCGGCLFPRNECGLASSG
jgi:hypothetical protein